MQTSHPKVRSSLAYRSTMRESPPNFVAVSRRVGNSTRMVVMSARGEGAASPQAAWEGARRRRRAASRGAIASTAGARPGAKRVWWSTSTAHVI